MILLDFELLYLIIFLLLNFLLLSIYILAETYLQKFILWRKRESNLYRFWWKRAIIRKSGSCFFGRKGHARTLHTLLLTTVDDNNNMRYYVIVFIIIY